jgi:DNA-binding CsgD family transcriptional regulator
MEFHDIGITIRHGGNGLGNQIFQICSGFAISKYINCPLYIIECSSTVNPHNKYKNNYKKNIFKYFDTTNNDISFDILINKYKYKSYNCNFGAYCKWNPLDMVKGSIISNFYGQYYPVLEPFKNDFSELLLKGIEDIRNDILLKNNITQNTIFMHIRRNDYVAHSDRYYVQPISYYEKSYNYINKIKKIDNVYILSDDIEWVKQQSFFQNIEKKIFWENDDELYSFCLMTLCTGGAICANSTFSWWGAFLGAYKSGSPVIVPEKWYYIEPIDLFPKEWIKF